MGREGRGIHVGRESVRREWIKGGKKGGKGIHGERKRKGEGGRIRKGME